MPTQKQLEGEPTARIGDKSDITPHASLTEDTRKVEDMLGKEFTIDDFETIKFTGDDGEIDGLSILGHDLGETAQFYIITFSEVLFSRITQWAKSELPVRGEISKAGKGQRQYFTIS